MDLALTFWEYLPEEIQDMAMTAMKGGEIDFLPGSLIGKVLGLGHGTIIVEPQPGPLFPTLPPTIPIPTECPTGPESESSKKVLS